jgi:regulatory protein
MYFKSVKTKTKQPDSWEHAYNYALFLLNLRLRTEGEMREKMQQRGYVEKVIDQVIAILQQDKLIDDERYLEIYIDNMKQYKYYGYYMIKKKLMERRLPKELIEAKLEVLITKDDEKELAWRLIKKETGGNFSKEQAGIEDKQKIARKLQARGFRTDVISRLLF